MIVETGAALGDAECVVTRIFNGSCTYDLLFLNQALSEHICSMPQTRAIK